MLLADSGGVVAPQGQLRGTGVSDKEGAWWSEAYDDFDADVHWDHDGGAGSGAEIARLRWGKSHPGVPASVRPRTLEPHPEPPRLQLLDAKSRT